MEANSWSLTSNEWNNIAENIPFSAICAAKKEVQTGTYVYEQCASNLVEASELHLAICYNF